MSRRLAEAAAGLLARRTSRRGFLVRAAVVGSAVTAVPLRYVLRPGSAYAAVCGPDTTCDAGYTVFCCSVYAGRNACPPGTFVAGWWKADGSSYCCDGSGRPGARYYIDCNATCTGCSAGCGGDSPFCDHSCIDCSCGCNDDAGSCDHRRVCCNWFRYGQCHQEIACSGPVVCRVITCTPPYQLFPSCGSTVLVDDRTADHTAPCLAGPCT